MISTQTASEPGISSYINQLVLETNTLKRQRLYRKVDEPLALIRSLKAEVDHYKDKDIALALHLGTCALELSKQTQSLEARPLALWAYALGLTVQGHFDEALNCFEESRALYVELGLEDEAARVAMRQIQALAMTGAFDKAIDLAKLTRTLLRSYGYERDALTVDNNLGIIYRRLGQFGKAEEVLEAALTGFDAVDDPSGKLLTLINLGNVCQEQDQFVRAEHYFKEGLELAEQLGQHKHAAGVTVNLALLYRGMGRQREALTLLTQVRTLYEQLPAGPDAALAQLEEARIHLDVSLFSEAITIASDLAEVFGAKEMTLEQTEALQVLGLAQARKGDLEVASTTLKTARTSWCVMGNEVQTALTDLSIASVKLELGQLFEAQALAEKAVLTLEAVGARSGQTLAYLLCAEIFLAQHQVKAAQHYLARAEQANGVKTVPELSFRTAYLKGKLALKQANLEGAKRYFGEAIFCLEGVQGALPVADFRAAYIGDKLTVYQDMIRLLAEQGDLSGIFDFTERAKSRALLNLLGSDVDLPTQDPQIVEVIEKLKQAREALTWYTLSAVKNREQMLASERDVTRLIRELERLAPDAAFETVTIPKLTELQAQLDAKTLWLEYFSLQGVLCALVITQTTIQFHQDLALESNVQQTFEWLEFYFSRTALGEDFVKAYGEERLNTLINESLHKLYKTLIAPLNLDTGAQTLIVSPHSLLYNVPFTALFDGQTYLGDAFYITLTPSASVYLHTKEPVSEVPASVVAFGMSQDLPGVQDELRAIADQVEGARLYLDNDATLATFLAEAPKAAVVHLATHGQFRPDNPTFSSLTLQDSGLTPRDLYATRLDASLVILSACQSGRVSGFYGDDLVGLARGFLDAGARALISTLWPTKDEQTAQFMTYLYKGLAEGMTIAEALEQAQRTLRIRYPNPYYWAAFTVIGDSNRRLNFSVSL